MNVSGNSGSGRTWTSRGNSSASSVSSSGGTFDIHCVVHSGAIEQINSGSAGLSFNTHISDYVATIPAGYVGAWSGSALLTAHPDIQPAILDGAAGHIQVPVATAEAVFP